MKRIILSLIFLAFAYSASATDYYVDADEAPGGDGSVGTPWDTVADVNAASLSPGDNVYFNRGDTWREQFVVPDSGTSGNPITFGAYGTGAKPMISGADVVSTWTAQSGDILVDDFDDNNVTGWTEPGGTIGASGQVLVTTIINTAGEGYEDYIYQNIGGNATEGWVSYDFEVDADGSANTKYTRGGGFSSSSACRLYVGYYNTSGVLSWRVEYQDDSGSTAEVQTEDAPIVVGDTYKVFAYWKQDDDGGTDTTDTGIVRVWVDGVLIFEKTDVDSDSLVITGVSAGNRYANYGFGTATLITDNIHYGTVASANDLWKAAYATNGGVVIFDGETGLKVDSIPKVLLREKYWYRDGTSLFISSATDPDSAYTTIESGSRYAAVNLGSEEYITLDGLQISGATASGIQGYKPGDPHLAASNIVVTNCKIWGNAREGIYGTDISGEYKSGWTITSNEISYNGHTGVGLSQGIVDVFIDGNDVHNNCQNRIEYNFCAGIRPVAPRTAYGNIITNNESYYNGYWSDNVTVVEDVQTTNTTTFGGGIWIDSLDDNDGNDPVIVAYNYTHHNAAVGIYIENTKGAKVYYNVTANNDSPNSTSSYGIRSEVSDPTHPNENLLFYNNTSYGSKVGMQVAGQWNYTDEYTMLNCVHKNNIIVGSVYAARMVLGGENATTATGSGYGNVYLNNSFGPEYSEFISWGLDTYVDTYDELESGYGGTTSSVEADPEMRQPANGLFMIDGGSPVINAGIGVGLSEDYLGNPIVGLPDIGAYEYQPDSMSFLIASVPWLRSGDNFLTQGNPTTTTVTGVGAHHVLYIDGSENYLLIDGSDHYLRIDGAP